MPRAKKPRKPVESPRLPADFDKTALLAFISSVARSRILQSWTYDSLAAARDQQIRGVFRQPVALKRSLMTDPAIYAASLNRGAPHRGLGREVYCREELTGSAANILSEAKATFELDTSSALPPGVLADAFDRVAWHATGIDQIHWLARPDGSRLDAFVQPFPLESVEWVPDSTCENADGGHLVANTTEGRIPIVHGDGRWIVYAKNHSEPWAQGALVALATLWSTIAFARRDQSKNSESHGESKWIGTLPDGVALLDSVGAPTAEAAAMLAQMDSLYEFRRSVVVPFGAKIEREEAMGANWQIFKELLEAGTKDVQRILLGQDGTMTNSGGDYIKSWGMFGVRNDIIESDISTVGSALSTGLLRPWSLINFGRWDRLAYRWKIPDADEDARIESIAARRKAFWEDVQSAKANGAIVDQEYIDKVAKEYAVKGPRLADSNNAPTVVPHSNPLRAVTAG